MDDHSVGLMQGEGQAGDTRVGRWRKRFENSWLTAPIIFAIPAILTLLSIWKDLPPSLASALAGRGTSLLTYVSSEDIWVLWFYIAAAALAGSLFLSVWSIVRSNDPKSQKYPFFSTAATTVSGILVIVFGIQGFAHAARRTPETVTAADVLRKVKEGGAVTTLIRLIPYNSNKSLDLAIGRLSMLGRQSDDYVFVADYSELRGRIAEDSAEMVGLSTQGIDHISVVIFPVEGNTSADDNHFPDLVPGDARGLLQVVRAMDNQYRGDPDWKAFDVDSKLQEKKYGADEKKNLEEKSRIYWGIEKYKDYYHDYCVLAEDFVNGHYSAKEKIGNIDEDWEPPGFVQSGPEPGDPCAYPERKIAQDATVTRVFLIRNKPLRDLRNQTQIDFSRPREQRIPDL